MISGGFVCGKVKSISTIDVENIRVYFECGSNHVIRPLPLEVGCILAIDTHGGVWVKQ